MDKQLLEFDDLMIDYLSGTLSGQDTQAFYTLLRCDVRYQQRYAEMSSLYAKSLIPYFEKEKKANYAKLIKQLHIGQKEKRVLFSWQKVYRIAAVVALVLTTSISAYYLYKDVVASRQEMALCQMEVPLGAQAKVILPDGSVVQLNSGTILSYDPSLAHNSKREVYLSGEAHFEVRKNPEHPFIVHTNDIHVKVLGTIFNVRAYPQDRQIEVGLIEGKVNVFSLSETQGNVILMPNERLLYDKELKRMWTDTVDARRMSQWTTGRLSFVNTSLVDILKEIERKYNVRIVVDSRRMKEEIFSGSISAKLTIDEILNYIDVDNKYRWERSGNLITITDN